MEEILNILFWIGTAAGGLLVFLLLMSIFSGLDLGGDIDAVDVDFDADVDVDADVSVDVAVDGTVESHPGGGLGGDMPLGLIKTVLTFVSVGAFTARAIFLNTAWSWALVGITSLIAGIAAVLLLSWFFKWLLKNQEEGNWHMWQAEGQVGTVYVPIPKNGKGRIIVRIDDANREIIAKSQDGVPIASKEKVLVIESEKDCVIVTPVEASVEL